MSFLAPLFLAGIALIAGPILFHLIKQAPRNRVVFSSTELLDASEPKTERSRRIQNPWLLLLRCLIVILLALAFARPFFPRATISENASDVQRNLVIAIDRSASMKRVDTNAIANAQVREILEPITSTDNLTILAFDDRTTTVLSNEQWRDWDRDHAVELALSQVARTPATDRPGKLDNAIRRAIAEGEALRESSPLNSLVEVYLISDFASGTSISGIAGLEWPAEFAFHRIDVAPGNPVPNIGLRWLGWDETTESEPKATLSLISSDPSAQASVTIKTFRADTDIEIAAPMEVSIEATDEKSLSIPIAENEIASPIRFELSGDLDSFDNTLYVAPNYTPTNSIAILSQSDTQSPRNAPYFLERAFAGFRSPAVSISTDDSGLGASDAYLIDRPLNATIATQIREGLSNGKVALLLFSREDILDTIAALTGSADWIAEKGNSPGPLIGDVTFSHPLFAPFRDPRFNNFASIRTWNPFALTLPEVSDANVLARYDNGDPLLVEVPIGNGSLFIWTSSWAPADSQWILSTKFVPFLHRFTLLASGGPVLPSNAVLTQNNAATYSDLLPDESFESAGLRVLAPDRWLALQIDPDESRTAPIEESTWEQLGLTSPSETYQQQQIQRIQAAQARESSIELERQQGIWRFALWAALILLGFESLLAIVLTKRKEAIAS